MIWAGSLAAPVQWQNIAQICWFDWTWHTVLTFGKDNWLFNNSCQAVINHAKGALSAAFGPLLLLCTVQIGGVWAEFTTAAIWD